MMIPAPIVMIIKSSEPILFALKKLYFMEKINQSLNKDKIFAFISTLGSVYPAADFINIAQKNKAKLVELNLSHR